MQAVYYIQIGEDLNKMMQKPRLRLRRLYSEIAGRRL